MPKKLRKITIVNEHTGKRIPINEIDNTITTGELLDALAKKNNLPAGTRGVLVRKLTHKQLFTTESLSSAGIEDGEILIVDFERTAGGHMEFYENGGVKIIETAPEETPYLAEILREIRRLNQEIRDVDEKLNVMSTEIKKLHNSVVVISGKDANIQKSDEKNELIPLKANAQKEHAE